MSIKGFSCKQCGKCCVAFIDTSQGCASEVDVELWEYEERDDILAWVDELPGGIYDIWIHPKTGDDVSRCPWLRKLPNQDKFVCKINDVKPEVCRNFPVTRKQAEGIGCKGFDAISENDEDDAH